MIVSLAYAPAPRQVLEQVLELPQHSTLHDALQASGWLTQYPELASDETVTCGIWGRKAARDQWLREGIGLNFGARCVSIPKWHAENVFSTKGQNRQGCLLGGDPGQNRAIDTAASLRYLYNSAFGA